MLWQLPTLLSWFRVEQCTEEVTGLMEFMGFLLRLFYLALEDELALGSCISCSHCTYCKFLHDLFDGDRAQPEVHMPLLAHGVQVVARHV